MIIGITGTLGAGKGTVVDYLAEKGFKHYSIREFLSDEIRRRNLPVNRNTLVEVGNDLREKYGSGYLAEQLYFRAREASGDCIIESLRNPGEVEILKSKGDFVLFAVDANIGLRYSRIINRKSSTDNISFIEFVENEKREFISNNANKQNLSKSIEMADYVFQNNGTIEELYKEIEKVLGEIKGEKIEIKKEVDRRPTWDEYFMEIARTVARRATCDRGKAGCVVARDKHILVTGYVGSPLGVEHCDEIGHEMKTVINEDGTTSQHCVRTTHAEQNALCQAAKLGISLNGGILYCKMTPCYTCAKMIINSGIKRVVAEKRYHAGKDSEELFRKAGIELEILNPEVEKYENQ